MSYLERSKNIFEPEPSPLPAAHWAVIPVYDENDSLPETLKSLACALKNSPEKVCIMLVVNEPLNAPEDAVEHNRQLLASLRKNDGKYDGSLVLGRELFFIDLTDKELALKYRNVGNARKSGFDTVAAQSDGKVTAKDQLFFSLDADTAVSANYFQAALAWSRLHRDSAGAVFHFEHRFDKDPAVERAAVCYEIYLRDYAWKLRQCGSIYNFWTIGSAFMCRASDYMRCGGMRRCAAGEDFYFLQALRKVGTIGVVPECTVYPAGRVSGRVPFGTGPAIARGVEGEDVLLYNQRCFDLLREFFSMAENADYELLSGKTALPAPAKLQEFLQTLDFSNIWQKITRNTPRNAEALRNALQIYCDGFFIMKFCHWLENNYPEDFSRQKIDPDADLPALLTELRKQDRQCYC